ASHALAHRAALRAARAHGHGRAGGVRGDGPRGPHLRLPARQRPVQESRHQGGLRAAHPAPPRGAVPPLPPGRRARRQGRAHHPEVIRRVRAKTGARFVNLFPDNPLWMIPFERIEAYDVFFTKERYALAALESVGLRNLHYLPLYCVPDFHHPVTLTDEERARFATPLAFVGSRYPYRERLMSELSDYPLRLWGAGWTRSDAPGVRARAAGGPVWGRAKLAVYSGSTLSLNPHHPMNDIVGVNTRAFELAASGACQVVD